MAIIKNVGPELMQTYKGFDVLKVGAGTDSSMYARDAYAKKKIQTLLMNGMSKIIYSGYDHQPDPLFIPMFLEPQYNVVTGLNLGYVPLQLRRAIVKYMLTSNEARIKSGAPMLSDWHSMKRAIPEISYITRRYKLTLIRVQETFPLMEWESAIKKEGDRWANHYKMLKEGTIK